MTETEKMQPSKPRRFVIGRPIDVPEGNRIIVNVDDREIGVYRIDGAFFALLNHCPHLGGPLCQGQLVSEVFAPVPGDVRGNSDRVFVTCPWHNWEFDVRTGQSYWNPMLRARPFAVDVERGEAVAAAIEQGSAGRVPGPYMAETIPVTIEDDYLVISLRKATSTRTETEATR